MTTEPMLRREKQPTTTMTMIIRADIFPFSALDAAERRAIIAAAKVRMKAQAPYSKFKVGAAIVPVNGSQIFTGCNVERVSHTQTTHAEQNALDSMVAACGGPMTRNAIRSVAIVAAPANTDFMIEKSGVVVLSTRRPSGVTEVGAPCGHCLQILWENCYGNRDVRLLYPTRDGEVVVTTIGSALPMAFGPDALGIEP